MGYWWCQKCQTDKAPIEILVTGGCGYCGSELVWHEIKIEKSNLHCDQRTGRQYYAHTDKGRIYGSTAEIVQRKIDRAGAGPWVPPPKDKPKYIDPEHEHDVPF